MIRNHDQGDVDLVSTVAGLAVGKPKDAPYSVADSALGKSVVSGATAKITRYSEVSENNKANYAHENSLSRINNVFKCMRSIVLVS